MRKDAFFKQLEYLLQDIPDHEREEAMSYYMDYLTEAGPEQEEQVIEEFGSPERVAAIIRADVTGNLNDGGSFTETGFEDERFRDPNYQVSKRLDLPEEREIDQETEKRQDTYQKTYQKTYQQTYHRSDKAYDDDVYTANYRECYTEDHNSKEPVKEKEKKRWAGSTWKWVLLGALLLLASPFLLGIGGLLLGAVTFVISMFAVVVVCTVLGTAVAFIVSVFVAMMGVGFVVTTPLDSLFLLGLSLTGIGCGLLGLALCVVLIGIVLPFCVKGIWKGIKRLTGKRKEAA